VVISVSSSASSAGIVDGVQEEKKSMMPWIIGGAVVLGVGVFAMKK